MLTDLEDLDQKEFQKSENSLTWLKPIILLWLRKLQLEEHGLLLVANKDKRLLKFNAL